MSYIPIYNPVESGTKKEDFGYIRPKLVKINTGCAIMLVRTADAEFRNHLMV
ncbi:MAG: hypothetical protein ACFFC6_03400 [Promethearchaeota archaeon]